jgi:hypothetical protein
LWGGRNRRNARFYKDLLRRQIQKGLGGEFAADFFVRKEQVGPRGKSYFLDLPKRFFSISLDKLGTGY